MRQYLTLVTLFMIACLPISLVGEVAGLNAATLHAVNDTLAFVAEDDTAIINFGLNDSIGELDAFHEIVVQPEHGLAMFDAAGNLQEVIYVPELDYYQFEAEAPIDSFQYSISIADGVFDSAWVYIDSIGGVNDRPFAVRDSYMMKQYEDPIIANVLSNDIDKDRAGLVVDIPEGFGAKRGQVSFHSSVSTFGGESIFMIHSPNTDYNTNLGKPFDERDTSYMSGDVFVYTPNDGYYGYDSIKYTIREYRPSPIIPLDTILLQYLYVQTEDIDTATVVFYVEPPDFLPTAIEDIIVLSENDEASVVDTMIYLCGNDLDADTVTSNPTVLFSVPFIIADEADSATATSDNDTILFIHTVPAYDELTGEVVYRQDTNMAVLINDSIKYSHAPNFCGVDSFFYCVAEEYDPNWRYPEYFKDDTSNLVVAYFVVKPVNDLPFTKPDTLVFDYSKTVSTDDGGFMQSIDILANDRDIDEIDDETLLTLKRLLGSDYDPNYADYGEMALGVRLDHSLIVDQAASPGLALCIDDSVYYQYNPLYKRESVIDSFSYVLYNTNGYSTTEWVYITNQAVEAIGASIVVSEPFIEDEENGTIASEIELLSIAIDTEDANLSLVLNDNGSLLVPSKSAYATIAYAGDGSVKYYYHKGFTELDSFQYVVTDILTNDTAWVYISNGHCLADEDFVFVDENPFSDLYSEDDPLVESVSVLDNDSDPEGILYIRSLLPMNDTIDTGSADVIFASGSDDRDILYVYKKEFFYKDTFTYVLTDVPGFFASDDFFTQDEGIVIVEDVDYLVDSDGDGIVNTMEDGVYGFQEGEDTLDFDNDGLPNYLDVDADNDNFSDNADCDGDGILNFLDDDAGCTDFNIVTMFTPNGDGFNDTFVIPELLLAGNVVAKATMRIYNRWGSLLYENEHYGLDGDWWDGTIGDVPGVAFGEELPNGVYLYYMDYATGDLHKEGYIHIQK